MGKNPRISNALKVSKFKDFSNPYFPIFRTDTKIDYVNLQIQFEYWRIFHAVSIPAYVLNAGIYRLWSLSKTVILTRWILYFLVFYAAYICCIVKC